MGELDDFEARLREFRPRRPASIPDERLQLLRGPMWVAVAAGLAAVMYIASRLQKPAPEAAQPLPPVTLGALNALADRPDALDAALAEISRTTLPDITRPGGVLERLSKF
jgi:hypothetical protein